jgi:hypothetical protein
MLFQKKQDFILPTQITQGAFGGTARFDISREYPIESLLLCVTERVTHTTASDPLADGIMNIIRKVQVTCADGARTRNVVDCSGPGLVELAKHWIGFLDRDTQARCATPSTGAPQAIATATDYNFIVPIFFCPPNIDDPLASALLLPADRFNSNIQMTVQFGAASDLYATVGDVTQTAAYPKCALIVNRRIVNRTKWPILDHEIFEQRKDFAATGDNYELEIPNTGGYTGLLCRCKRASAAALNRRGDVSVATLGDHVADNVANWELKVAGNTLRRFRVADLERENDYSCAHGVAAGDVLPGSYFMDFIGDRVGASGGDPAVVLGSLLNANIPLNSGVRIVLRQSIGVALAQIDYVFHRIYGNLSAFKA